MKSSHQRRLVCSAPGRAGIIGNPTDMYGGSVLSCSMAMRACATITSLASHEPSGSSSSPQRGPEIVLESGGEEFRIVSRRDLRPRGDRFDIVRAVLDYMHLPPFTCRVIYESDIPMRSGMAGSTALVVALLQAFLAWQGQEVNRYQLAERARYIELNNLKVVCGYQDAVSYTHLRAHET